MEFLQLIAESIDDLLKRIDILSDKDVAGKYANK